VLRTIGLLCLGFFLCARPVAAQDQPAPPPDESVPAAVVVPPVGLKDVGDVWRHIRHKTAAREADVSSQSPKKPFFFVSPSISSKPSTGLSVGVASSVVFIAGDAATTHISSADLSASASQKGQAGTGLRFRVYSPDNKWFIQADNRLAWTSQSTYALGIVSEAPGEKLKYNRFRVYDTAFRQLGPHLFVGFGLNVNNHTNVRAGSGPDAAFQQSAYAAYTAEQGFALNHQVSAGTNVGVFLDTRDNPINASRGWFTAATYRSFYDGFLGGSSSWQLLEVDARTYKTLTRDGRQKIAFWMLGNFANGPAPYLDLPAIAEDTYGRSARGYTTGRYRGPHMVYGEVEYRTTFTANGLLGAVGFVNATAIDGETSDRTLFGTVAPAAGGGLRVLLSKRSKANFCLDYGWGVEGSSGLYIAVRETF